VFIDKVTSYLMSGVKIAVEPWDTSPEAKERANRAEIALKQVYEENHLEALDLDTEIDTAILGDGCFKVIWDPEEGKVKVSSPDVQGIFAWWVGDDPSKVWQVASRYKLSQEEANLLYGIKLSLKREVTIVEVWTKEKFELWLENSLVEKRANPYGFIPFIIFPNLREPKKFWGLSDITLIREPAQELNRAFSQLSMILELSGNPIAVVENVEDARDIAVQPGAMWVLPEKARAYLLDLLQGGGVKLHVDYIDLLYRALHDLAEAPRTAFGDNPRALSGVALEMELHPLLQKVRRKRLIRTGVYKKRAEMILSILEQKTGIDYLPCLIRIIWGPILPQDRSRMVRDEEILVQAGIHSRRRAMTNLGVDDAEAEYARWLEEKKIEQQIIEPMKGGELWLKT